MKRKYFAYPYLLWMFCLILAPMLLIAYYAFTNQIDGQAVFTLTNMREALDASYMRSLGYSLAIAALTTVVCFLIAYPVAYFLSKMKAKTAAVVSLLFILPMWLNMLLRTYAWMGILQNMNGYVNSFLGMISGGTAQRVQLYPSQGAVILGLVYNFLPFMILPLYNTLQKIPKENIEAAQDLGANSTQVFTRIIFPQSIPGIVTGFSMVFIPSISTFSISRLLGGGKSVLYGDVIESLFTTSNNWNLGSALSLILTVLVLISMLITAKVDRQAEGSTSL